MHEVGVEITTILGIQRSLSFSLCRHGKKAFPSAISNLHKKVVFGVLKERSSGVLPTPEQNLLFWSFGLNSVLGGPGFGAGQERLGPSCSGHGMGS